MTGALLGGGSPLPPVAAFMNEQCAPLRVLAQPPTSPQKERGAGGFVCFRTRGSDAYGQARTSNVPFYSCRGVCRPNATCVGVYYCHVNALPIAEPACVKYVHTHGCIKKKTHRQTHTPPWRAVTSVLHLKCELCVFIFSYYVVIFFSSFHCAQRTLPVGVVE